MKTRTRTTTRNDSESAARLRLVVTRLIRSIRQNGATGLTPSQISALATIEDVGAIRISDLAMRESVGAPVATRVVATLVDLGLLQRIDDATDARVCIIDLTPKGRRILKQLWSERTAGLSSRIENLSATDFALLRAALPVLETLAHD